MGSIGKIELGTEAETNEETYFALSASPDETVSPGIPDTSARTAPNVGSCQPANHDHLWDYNDNLVSRVSKPDDCFRLTVDHGLGRNYLDAYSVEFEPIGGDVNGSWGKIDWEAWEELTCEPQTFTARRRWRSVSVRPVRGRGGSPADPEGHPGRADRRFY